MKSYQQVEAQLGYPFGEAGNTLQRILQTSVLMHASPRPTAQRAAVACIAVLIDSSVVQLLLFCAVHATILVILVRRKPFANR